MKFWTGVITDKLAESKSFYVNLFGCEVLFEEDWFVLLKLGPSELGFLRPDMDGQHPLFQKANPGSGYGMWITVEVEDAVAEYERIKKLGRPIEQDLRDEAWGDRHFVVKDPNGLGVDVMQRIA